MQQGARCPNSDYLGFETSPEAIVAAAKKAEEVGFDAIFVNDQIIGNSGSHATRRWRKRDSNLRSPVRITVGDAIR